MYSTDNGPHMNTWPDGGDDAVPEREEHELGRRVPCARGDPLARQDPGRRRLQRDRPAPRLAADVPGSRRRAGRRREAEGRPCRSATRPTRCTSTATTCCPYLTGEAEKSPRQGMRLLLRRRRRARAALRQLEGRLHGAAGRRARCGSGPSRSSPLRRSEALQPAHRPVRACRRDLEHLLRLVRRQRLPRSWPATAVVAQFLETFKEFPPRQKAASFTIDQVVEKLEDGTDGRAVGMDRAARILERHADARGDRRASPRRRRRRSRPRSGSRSSTTTARSGARSRCRSRRLHPPRLAAMAEAGRVAPRKQPWQAAYEKDYAWLGGCREALHRRRHRGEGAPRGRDRGFRGHRRSTSTPPPRPAFLSTHRIRRSVAATCATARTCRWSSSCAISRATGFTCFIASGGSRDFMRTVSDELYEIPRTA